MKPFFSHVHECNFFLKINFSRLWTNEISALCTVRKTCLLVSTEIRCFSSYKQRQEAQLSILISISIYNSAHEYFLRLSKQLCWGDNAFLMNCQATGTGTGNGTGNRESRIETVPVLTVKCPGPPTYPTAPPPNYTNIPDCSLPNF